MPINRFYTTQPLIGDIILEDSEYHHLVRSTRTRAGETVEVTNGKGELAVGVVDTITKNQAKIRVEKVDLVPAPKKQVILAQGLPRMNKLDWILEKGTELGATAFWLFPGDKSDRVEINAHQTDRLENILVGALKQSGSLWKPTLKFLPPLSQWTHWPKRGVFGDVRPNAMGLLRIINQFPQDQDVVCVIGPESGLSDAEVELLASHHFTGVSLSHQILRTETAAIAALAIINMA